MARSSSARSIAESGAGIAPRRWQANTASAISGTEGR
jgi:hypothetical protein